MKGLKTAIKVGLFAKKHWPTIAFVGGIGSMGFSVVQAYRRKESIADYVWDFKNAREDCAKAREDDNKANFVKSFDEGQKAILEVVKQSAWIVLPAIAGVGLLTASHITLVRRLGKAVAMANNIGLAFSVYRATVEDKVGKEVAKEVDREYINKVEDKFNDATDEARKFISVAEYVFGFKFDQKCSEFVPFDDFYNRCFVRKTIGELEKRFGQRGYITVDHVLAAFGHAYVPETENMYWEEGMDFYVDEDETKEAHINTRGETKYDSAFFITWPTPASRS